MQRYRILFVCGNYSRILSRLNRNITEMDVLRAFTSFQLMTILDENRHSFLIVEHDPMLYEDAAEMVEYVAQHLRQTSREATVLLYSLAMDSHFEKMTPRADRVFCNGGWNDMMYFDKKGFGTDAKRVLRLHLLQGNHERLGSDGAG